MGRSNKWIESAPGELAVKVARRALASRLERTWHYLEAEMQAPRHHTENVHQLRVFARRATSTLDIFAAFLPQRRADWMSRQLKRIRRAAGQARDFDVLLVRWLARVQRSSSHEAALLLEHVKDARQKGQRPIAAIYKKLARKRFERRASELLQRVRERGGSKACDGRFACAAQVALRRMVAPYLQAAQAEMVDVEALHAFRIQGKQVRYAMEIFAGAFEPEFRDQLYPVVAGLLERLGAVNDHVTAEIHFARWLAETDSFASRQALEWGIEQEQRALEASHREFLEWWTRPRRDELHRAFSHHLQLGKA